MINLIMSPILIIFLGLIVSWRFSKSVTGIKIKANKLEEEYLTSLVRDAGVVSAHKRLVEFFFDIVLCNFAFNIDHIVRHGFLYSFQENIQWIGYKLFVISPVKVFVEALMDYSYLTCVLVSGFIIVNSTIITMTIHSISKKSTNSFEDNPILQWLMCFGLSWLGTLIVSVFWGFPCSKIKSSAIRTMMKIVNLFIVIIMNVSFNNLIKNG